MGNLNLDVTNCNLLNKLISMDDFAINAYIMDQDQGQDEEFDFDEIMAELESAIEEEANKETNEEDEEKIEENKEKKWLKLMEEDDLPESDDEF